MKLNRREVLKGGLLSLGFMVLPGGLFAAPAGWKLKKSVYARGYCMGIGHEPEGGVTTLEIPQSELPSGKLLSIAVRPCSSLATRGKPISATLRV